MAELHFVWLGDRVANDVVDATVEGLNDAAGDAEPILRSLTPVRTGFLRDSSYAIVDVAAGHPTLVIGQYADYALYVEFGTRFMSGHYQITQTVTQIFPTVNDRIAQVLNTRGYGVQVAMGSDRGIPNPYTGGRLSGLLSSALREAPLNP